MFTGEMYESKAERITLQEIDSKALSLLVDFVYTSEIHVTEDNVQVSSQICLFLHAVFLTLNLIWSFQY